MLLILLRFTFFLSGKGYTSSRVAGRWANNASMVAGKRKIYPKGVFYVIVSRSYRGWCIQEGRGANELPGIYSRVANASDSHTWVGLNDLLCTSLRSVLPYYGRSRWSLLIPNKSLPVTKEIRISSRIWSVIALLLSFFLSSLAPSTLDSPTVSRYTSFI